jgi:hypothetical protein
MAKKQLPKRHTRKKGNLRKDESLAKEPESALSAGDIVIYSSIVENALFIDENDGKVYLCLGNAESEELGKVGAYLSGSFPSIRIMAVLESGGDVSFFLPEELVLARERDE